MSRKKRSWQVLGYTSPQHMISTHRKWHNEWRQEDRRVNFVCRSCGRGFSAFKKCRIKKVYCGECGALMERFRGFFCELRPELKQCDSCGCCDTGTDADFDKYAVQVQNGEGYYDAAGTFHFYENWRDD